MELRAVKEVVLAAVTEDGWALQFASVELRADKDVVLAAVRRNGAQTLSRRMTMGYSLAPQQALFRCRTCQHG